MPEPERRLVPKPRWLIELEAALARAISVHPHWLSAAKLLLLTPLFYLGLSGTVPALSSPWVILPAFALFAALDYLDGVVARGRGLESGFGRVFDRATDYPVLLLFAAYAYASVPRLPLVLKLGFDVLLLVLFLLGRGSTENRLRTTLSYTALVGLLFVSRGWLPEVFTVHLISGLLWLGAGFSAMVALYNLRILQKRFIADGLSALNLGCGVWSIALASQGQFVASLVLLIVGAAFDGFDGAAARRWGGTRFGVYSDDNRRRCELRPRAGCSRFLCSGRVGRRSDRRRLLGVYAGSSGVLHTEQVRERSELFRGRAQYQRRSDHAVRRDLVSRKPPRAGCARGGRREFDGVVLESVSTPGSSSWKAPPARGVAGAVRLGCGAGGCKVWRCRGRCGAHPRVEPGVRVLARGALVSARVLTPPRHGSAPGTRHVR